MCAYAITRKIIIGGGATPKWCEADFVFGHLVRSGGEDFFSSFKLLPLSFSCTAPHASVGEQAHEEEARLYRALSFLASFERSDSDNFQRLQVQSVHSAGKQKGRSVKGIFFT